MVNDVLLHPELLQQTCTLQCFSYLHGNGFFTIVGLHFIFRHMIGAEVLHNFLLSVNISNFANIHWVPILNQLNLLFVALYHLMINKQLFQNGCPISIGGAILAMAKAVANCFWLHIHALGYNNNVHSFKNVDIFVVCYLVLKTLNEEAIKTASIICLEASDNSCVARLNLWVCVWRQIE